MGVMGIPGAKVVIAFQREFGDIQQNIKYACFWSGKSTYDTLLEKYSHIRQKYTSKDVQCSTVHLIGRWLNKSWNT